jgi:predicted HNH restriction endonuclease
MFEVKNSFAELGMAVDVKLNVSEAVSDELMLPPSIEAISISSKAMIQERNPSEVAGDVATSVIATLLALLPIDDPANDGGELGIQFDADVEGARSRKEVNFYERSRANRAVAIAIHGTTCQVCDINFGDRYGELGVGYIEIHHLTPVSQMGAERVVDPAKELVPLCANCHRMAHRRSPPVSPSDLRLLLARFDG